MCDQCICAEALCELLRSMGKDNHQPNGLTTTEKMHYWML